MWAIRVLPVWFRVGTRAVCGGATGLYIDAIRGDIMRGGGIMSEVRTAACLAVGSELLGDERLDSNSLRITSALASCGVRMIEKRVVGDSVEGIAHAIDELLESVDLIVITGGLGPTADDVTREAVAQALGRELQHSQELEGWIRARYAAHEREMPEPCVRMAKVVEGARTLANTRGSAPGMLIEVEDRLLAIFPGVPWEMEEMLTRDLVPELRARNPAVRIATRTLLLGGVFESDIEERIGALYKKYDRESVTVLAKCGVVRLVLSVQGDNEAAAARIEAITGELQELLGHDVAGIDVDGLEEVVLGQLRDRGQTLASAESCTGGLLAARITDVPGASDVFLGGVVSYSNEVKERQLGVPVELLIEHGAVSEPVARAMAMGVRDRFDADWGIGITGIAGPGGGSDEKPVGLVHFAVASSNSVATRHQVFPGNREVVRLWSVQSTLDLLRRQAMKASE
jgi:nicotinamide-nucleotide amidase